jgi:hypothetical protein
LSEPPMGDYRRASTIQTGKCGLMPETRILVKR